jgi:hypothetical protein
LTSALSTVGSSLARELGGYSIDFFAGPKDLDTFIVGTSASTLWGQHGGNEDPVYLKVGLRSTHVTHCRTGIQQCSLKGSFRLFGAGGSPGPGSIVSLTGQLNFDTSAHRCSGLSG